MSLRRRALLGFALLASYAIAALPVCLVQPPELASGLGRGAHPAEHATQAGDPHAGHHGHHAMVQAAAPPCLCGCKGWLRASPSAGISFVSLPAAEVRSEPPLLFTRPVADATPSAPSAPTDPPEHVPIAA